jgi:NhaA family Na+:H+ antiporter
VNRSKTRLRRIGPATNEFARYLRTETTGGMILLGTAVLALLAANSPWADSYTALRNHPLGPPSLHLSLTMGEWATDGLLAVFFYVAGCELKRELVIGELRKPRAALLPVFAAIGGMAIPAGVCLAVGFGAPGASSALAVPVATDIAFALAVLAVTASALPSSVRVFLLSLAVVDDLGGIALIAILFTKQLSWLALAVAAVLLLVFWLLQYGRVRSPWLYVPLALGCWAAVHASGIHATVAGIALGLLTRARRDTGEAASPVIRMEHRLQPFSAVVCVPVFAFFAAGVALDATALRSFGTDRVALAVVAGLVAGKFLGVTGGGLLAIRLGLATMPAGVGRRDLAAVGVLAGCGFTVSLLIAELSFGATSQAERIRTAVLAGSVISSALAAWLLHLRVRARQVKNR